MITKLLTYIFIFLFTFTSSVNAGYFTHATIGKGVIEVAQSSDLTGLNRDTSNAQEITKDMTTGTLDATASIDNRVFTSDGRAEIAREHKKAGSFIENVSFPK